VGCGNLSSKLDCPSMNTGNAGAVRASTPIPNTFSYGIEILTMRLVGICLDKQTLGFYGQSYDGALLLV